jgi:serine phosphatase RsbU (regulator of sigma subunit)/HAMP domain-containing protein
MKFRFTIGRKIWLGFGLFIFFTILNFVLTYITLHNSRKLNDEVTKIYNPSAEALDDLDLLLVKSQKYICNWIFVQSGPDNIDKLTLRKLIKQDYPHKRREIEALSAHWDPIEKEKVNKLFVKIDSLFGLYRGIMTQIKDFTTYEDAYIIFLTRSQIEGGNVDMLTREILDDLAEINETHRDSAHDKSVQMISSFDLLQAYVTNAGVLLVILGFLSAFFTIRTIVPPLRNLRQILLKMGKGILPDKEIEHRQDEIGDMTGALNVLVDGLKRTTDFSREIGSGNFEGQYVPLSDQDTLGHALLKMRDDLFENERMLENKVKERTEEVVKQKEELEKQNDVIEEKNHKLQVLYNDVTDSIKYALRIQQSILPPTSYVKKFIPDVFFLYKPKDIISGDFYWFEEQGEDLFIAAVDCTGHGVPGALMSMVGNNILNRSVTDHLLVDSAAILDELNEGVSRALRVGQEDAQGSKDGMDIALCRINYTKNLIQYAGAFNPLYRIRNGELEEFKADKFPIGHYAEDPELKYKTIDFEIQKGDTYYIFTDGYADQFGGPKGKKFLYKRFKELLLEICTLPMAEQQRLLDKEITEWMGDVEPQLDDILVIGFRL